MLKKKETEEFKVLSRLEKEMEELKVGVMKKKTEQEQYESELAVVKEEAQVCIFHCISFYL